MSVADGRAVAEARRETAQQLDPPGFWAALAGLTRRGARRRCSPRAARR